jgi:hypothetical protein
VNNYLNASAAAPLTAAERAQLGRFGGEDDAEIIIPVPGDAGLPPIKLKNRQADRSYAYRDSTGALLGRVLRWDAHNGSEKEIRPATFWKDANGKRGWRSKTWPTPRPLFGLDRLAARPDAIVLLVEGEKAAEAVESGPLADAFKWAQSDVIAVTWPGGTNAIGSADFAPLAGRDVVILPDNDEPGEKAADQLVEVLHRVGVRRLRRWTPPIQAKVKWDIADDLPAGSTPEALVESILAAPEIALPRIVKTLSEFMAEFVSPDYLVDGLLQKHFFYSVTGATGAGKSAIALLLAILVASKTSGQKLGPHQVEHGRVVYIAAENPTDIRMRLIGMSTKLNLDIDPGNFLAIEQIDALEKDMPRIKREIAAFGDVDLVIIDTAPSLFAGDNENDNRQMRDHAKRLRTFCDLPGRPCVVALCHPPKHPGNPEQLLPRGGGAFLAEVDGNLTAWLHDGNLSDLHWTGKFRGPDFAKITFRLAPVITTNLTDTKGRILPTVMAEAITDAEAEATENRAVRHEDQLLAAMLNNPGGSLAEWARACRWLKDGKLETPDKKRAENVMNRLKRLKPPFVKMNGRDYVLSKEGKTAAKKAAASPSQSGGVSS